MIDIVLLAVIALSALLGLLRGFVSIVLSLLSWVLGAWAALSFGEATAHWWATPEAPDTGHFVAGYVSIFLLVMLSVWGVGLVIRQLVRATSLNGPDRLLGGVLGVARGALIGCVLLLAASYTPLTGEASWQHSHLRPLLEPGVRWLQARMPGMPGLPPLPGLDDLARLQALQALPLALPEREDPSPADPELGKPGLTGDNGVLAELLTGRGWPRPIDETPPQAVDRADVRAGSVSPGSPGNLDPAPPRQGQPDPASAGSPDQARSPSQ